MVIMQFKMYLFLIHCLIFPNQYKFTVALVGPSVRRANNNEFPGLVAIMSLHESGINEIGIHQRCTGTLVSKQDVITAEHCLRDTFTEGFKVLVGSIDLVHATEFYPMFVLSYEQWILYRQRTLELDDHDICIIKLLENVAENIEISPIGNIESNLLYGLNAEITGWGRLTNLSKPRILHTAAVKIMKQNECQTRIYTLEGLDYNIDDKVLCTIGDPYAVLGHGDSGGSLIFCGTIVGINNAVLPSYGGAIHPDQVNIHLNLRFYFEYIQDVITRFCMHF